MAVAAGDRASAAHGPGLAALGLRDRAAPGEYRCRGRFCCVVPQFGLFPTIMRSCVGRAPHVGGRCEGGHGVADARAAFTTPRMTLGDVLRLRHGSNHLERLRAGREHLRVPRQGARRGVEPLMRDASTGAAPLVIGGNQERAAWRTVLATDGRGFPVQRTAWPAGRSTGRMTARLTNGPRGYLRR